MKQRGRIKNKKETNSKGITLVALVVTIIVLLILAAVSIATLTGENGLLTRVNDAKEQTEIASEREGITLDVIEYQMDEKNKTKLGVTLYTKNADNSAIWDVFVNNTNNITYGTGWNYINKGTNIENFGEIKNEYLVNYETGEIIQIDENYIRLKHGNSIGVTDGLIFNIDPSIIDDADINDLKNGNYDVLWKDTELLNFDWNNESGLTSKSFNFDGVNDYIKVKYDKEEQKQTLAKNGFTFEYYGTINSGTSYDQNGNVISNLFKGIFCACNENEEAVVRFGIQLGNNNKHNLRWNAGNGNYISDFSEENHPYNIWYPIEYNLGEDIYYTITLDTTNSYEKDGEQYYKQTVYLNGKKLYEGGYNKKTWDDFVEKYINSLNYFHIGRSSMSSPSWWHYSKLNAYTLRLYNHALSSDEAKDNYDKSVAYHESL